MAANPLQFETMQAKLGNANLICCLHTGGFDPGHGIWCATDNGGVCHLEVVSNPDGGASRNVRLGDVMHLSDAASVADYVKQATLQYLPSRPNRTQLLESRIEALTVLALYPGYFRPHDSDERRSLVVQAFIDAIAGAGMPQPMHWFTCFVYFLFLVHGATPLHVHLLRHLPSTIVGALMANGLTHEKVWQERHMEALEEGWRYQLAHPDEEYLVPLATKGEIHLKPLIDYAGQEVAHRLLAATGLSLADAARAREIGAALAGDEMQAYTRAVLTCLSQNAGGHLSGQYGATIGLPADLMM